MSDIGGELDSMRATAQRFRTAGDSFNSRLDDLARRMTDAASRFVETAQQALADANTLTAEVDVEMTGLRQQGDTTTWRGTNRERFVGDMAAFHSRLGDATTRMRSFVEQVRTQVSGPLQTQIAEFSTDVRTSGASAQEISTSFNAAVDAQATALDSAMNQGWSSRT